MDTLVLNANYFPLGTCSWQDAFRLVYQGKFRVDKVYQDRVIKSAHESHHVPSVIVSNTYIDHTPDVKFSRKNVYERDNYTCQYCGNKYGRHALTFDHVIPRSKGGGTSWENIVTSCAPCNTYKGDKTPEQAGLRLLRKPKKPPHFHHVKYKIGRSDHKREQWFDYMFWED